MASIINASVASSGIVSTADASGIIKVQSDGKNVTAGAWVNFNGVTTVTIRSQYNVSSVARNSVGNYTINFTNAFSDANYAVASINDNTDNWSQILTLSAGSANMSCRDSGTTLQDATTYTAIFFGQ